MLEVVTERRRPHGDVHRPGLGQVLPEVVRRPFQDLAVDAEEGGQPPAVAAEMPGGRVVGRVLHEEVVVRLVGIFPPRVPGGRPIGVVRRSALGEEAEALAAGLVVGDQGLQLVGSVGGVGGQPGPEDEQPIEAVGRLGVGEVDPEPHADVHRPVEVDGPGHGVGYGEVRPVRG